MSPGRLPARAAAGTEIGTGRLLEIGFFTPFAAAGMVGPWWSRAWTVHRKHGFMIVNDGWEYTFVVGFVAVFVAALGPGQASVDHIVGLADVWNGWVGLLIASALGVAGGIGQLTLFFRPPGE